MAYLWDGTVWRADTVTVGGNPLPPPPTVTPILYSDPEIINPARGQYIDLSQPLKGNWPGTFDTGDRTRWRQISNGVGARSNVDFSLPDQRLAQAAAAGRRFHFRFMSMCSTDGPGTVLPAWLTALSGATITYNIGGSNYVIPDWNNNTYLTELETLIAALGARYDHDERLEWFEVSGYGDFSENHCSFLQQNGFPGPTPANSVATLGYYSAQSQQLITKASVTRLMNATFAAFPNTRIVATYANPEIMTQLLARNALKPAGIRGDSLGTQNPVDWFGASNDSTQTALYSRWQTAPVISEWHDNYYPKALTDTVNFHVSLVGSMNLPGTIAAGSLPDFTRTCKYAGYRYAAAGSVSGNLVVITWANYGVAPTYERWDVVYEIRDSTGAVMQTNNSTFNLKTLVASAQNYSNTALDPTSASATDSFTLISSLASGTYTIMARVNWNEHKAAGTNTVNFAPMVLALNGRDGTGAYTIGTFTI